MKEINERMILNGIDANDFTHALTEAIEHRHLSEMDDLLTLFSTFCFKDLDEAPFPEDIFSTILNAMRTPEFQQLSDSSILMIVFEQEWGRLVPDQKVRLLDVINSTYQKFEDPQSRFILAELLGEYYASRDALEVIEAHLLSDNENIRANLTYGLRKLAKCATEDEVKRQAILGLKLLINDPSENVRDEANVGLSV